MQTATCAALEERLRTRTAIVGVVGMGYVGLPLSVELAQAGFTVIGYDINTVRVANINSGQSYIEDVSPETLHAVVDAGHLSATCNDADLHAVEVFIICVPTPLDSHQVPDTSYIVASTRLIRNRIRSGQLVILESTTYPGTTEDLVRPILEESGLKAGSDFFLAFSPERVDPGNKTHHTGNTPKIVGGLTPACTELAVTLYGAFLTDVHRVSSPRAAEMTKLVENIYRLVNISLVNELALWCGRNHIDIWEVIAAASTKPYGFMPFYPGPGIGGHCIPIDPYYLTWLGDAQGFTFQLIESAGAVNDAMPRFVVSKVTSALNTQRKALMGARVYILGMAYKADIGDMRASPSVHVAELLLAKGAMVSYHDPHVPSVSLGGQEFRSVELTDDGIRNADAVLILTAHSGINYHHVASTAQLTVDMRNAVTDRSLENVFRL